MKNLGSKGTFVLMFANQTDKQQWLNDIEHYRDIVLENEGAILARAVLKRANSSKKQ